MTVIPPGFAQINFIFGGSTLPTGAMCTQGIVAPEIGTITAYMADLSLAAATLHEQISGDNCILETVEVKMGPNATGPTFSEVVNQAGGQGVNTTPPGVSVLVRKTPDGVSNRFAGRVFWPSPAEAEVDSAGSIQGPEFDQYQDAFDAFGGFLVTANTAPVILRAASSDPTNQLGYEVQLIVGTQRRRQRR